MKREDLCSDDCKMCKLWKKSYKKLFIIDITAKCRFESWETQKNKQKKNKKIPVKDISKEENIKKEKILEPKRKSRGENQLVYTKIDLEGKK